MHRTVADALEFDKVLQLVAAHARTGVGRRRVIDLEGHFGGVAEWDRAAALTTAVHDLVDDGGALTLAGIDDAVPLLEDGSGAPSEPQELLALLTLARRAAAVRRRLTACGREVLEDFAETVPETRDLVDEVAPLLGRDGRVADDATPELSRSRREIARVRARVLEALDLVRRRHAGVVTDAPPTLRRDRYCLPVHSQGRTQLPGLVLDVSARGATAFVEPFEVVDLNNRLAIAMAGEREEIQRILRRIAAVFAERRDDLGVASDRLAELDAFQARVLFGRVVEGRVMVPGSDDRLALRGARHPLLDERIAELRREVFGEDRDRTTGRRVVPLDFALPHEVRTVVISGPNAGGKTVVLKTIGLMVLMAYRGIPVPVDEASRIPRYERLWCHIGDEQDVAADLSTFSGAMAATACLLEDVNHQTLVLYDELGAGTDPLEGAAIGCALLERLTASRATTVVSTHLASIAMVASSAEAMNNAAMDYDEASERPTYRLGFGRPGRSRALQIAARMGVPAGVLDRARSLLGGEHLELDRWLRRLEELEQALERERQGLKMQLAEAGGAVQAARRERERLEAELRQIPERLAADREELRRRAKRKLDRAIARLEAAVEEREALGRRKLQKLREQALDLEPLSPGSSAPEPADLREGARVRLQIGGSGVLRELRGTRARVEVGGKKLWVPRDELEVLEQTPPPPVAKVRVDTADAAPRELNLIGLDSERAREDLERFLDQAMAAGSPSVRVVHGHGAGVLRRMVAEVCGFHPAVRSFRHPPQHLGGTGATEVELHSDG